MKGYLLEHIYEFCNKSATKILGLYATQEEAEAAKQRFLRLEGFKDFPEICFVIDEYEFGKDSFFWGEGFTNYDRILEALTIITNEINQLAGVKCSPEQAWKNIDYYDVYCMVSDMIYEEQDEDDIVRFVMRMLHDYMNTDVDEESCRAAVCKMVERTDELYVEDH